MISSVVKKVGIESIFVMEECKKMIISDKELDRVGRIYAWYGDDVEDSVYRYFVLVSECYGEGTGEWDSLLNGGL